MKPRIQLPPQPVLAGTGHRPDKIGFQERYIREHIRTVLLHYCPSEVVSGMAVGFDQWWADEALSLGFRVHAAVPFLGQESRWPREVQTAYHALLRRVHVVTVVTRERPANDTQANNWLMDRNAFMVDRAHGVIACYNGDLDGGTCNAVRYAQIRRKLAYTFNPYDLVPDYERQA